MFRKNIKNSTYLGESPNEFEVAKDTTKKIQDKVSAGDIDSVTAEKRIKKIMDATSLHDNCLQLFDAAEPKKRKVDCFHSYLNIFTTLKHAQQNSSDVDRTIKSAIKYVNALNALDAYGEMPEMAEAKNTIKELKNKAMTDQVTGPDIKNLTNEIKQKMNEFKLCSIWAATRPHEKRTQQYDCSSQSEALKNTVMKATCK